MRFVLLALLGLFLAIPALADVRIGNGGEAIENNGTLRLRDFYVGGVYREPKVILSGVRTEASNAWATGAGFELDTAILDAKMAEIYALSRPLGNSIVQVLRGCWVYSQMGLWTVDAADGINYSGKRVALAIRGTPVKTCTTINQSNWLGLSHVDRVGLLVHEAVSTLLQPICDSMSCRQDSPLVRDIVASLFYAREDGRSELPFEHSLALRLFENSASSRSTRENSMSLLEFDKSDSDGKRLLTLSWAWIPTEARSFVDRICRYVIQRNSPSRFFLELTRPRECTYMILEGRDGQTQARQRAGLRSRATAVSLPSQDLDECVSKLNNEVTNWFGSYIGAGQGNFDCR